MKRFSIIILAAMALNFAFTSCQKEQLAGGTFSATMERYASKDSKTVYDSTNSTFSWVTNDEIYVFRRQGSSGTTLKFGRYRATSVESNRAIFSYVTASSRPDVTNEAQYSGLYHAFCPSSIYKSLSINPNTGATSSLSVELPTTQSTDAGGNLIGFPMYAESTDQHLQFTNLCGLMRLSLQKNNTNIIGIRVTTNTAINGEFTVNNISNGTPTLQSTGTITDARKIVKLVFATPQSINSQRDFFIALPNGTYTTLEIKIYASDGSICTKTLQNGTLQIARNKYTIVDLSQSILNFESIVPNGTKGGVFSVSSGTKVMFSQGNLQYQAVSNPTQHVVAGGEMAQGKWRFADNQYDFIGSLSSSGVNNLGNVSGSNNAMVSNTYTEWIDLFGRGTSGYDGKNPYNHSTNDYYCTTDMTDTYYDWGKYNSISNGGETPGLWRVLTSSEYYYLFNARPASTINGTAGSRFVKAIVNGVKGIILFPDVFEWPMLDEGHSNYKYPNGINDGTIRYTGNGASASSYSVAEWSVLEDAGAIFLPQTSYWSGTNFVNTNNGYYWASDLPSGSTSSYYYWTFNNTSITGTSGSSVQNAYYGYSVRLVCNIEN